MSTTQSGWKYLCAGGALLLGDVFCVWFLEGKLLRLAATSIFLALPLAFCFLHLFMVGVITGSLMALKGRREFWETRARELGPELRAKFAEHGYGIDQTAALRPFLHKNRPVVERLLIEFLPSVRGQGRDQLGQLADELGFTAKWNAGARSRNPQRRKAAVSALALLQLDLSKSSLRRALSDREAEIRILASRALVQSGDPEVIEAIFTFSLDQTLRVRACLTEDLRKHATVLCATVVPKILETSDQKRIATMVEMLAAWKRSIRLDCWSQLLEHSSDSTRKVVLGMLPYISTSDEAEDRIIAALPDPDPEFRHVAAGVAAQWELQSALPALASLLADQRIEIGRAAAHALTRLGNTGERVLEAAILGSERRTAGVALEALECYRTGRVTGVAI